MDKDERVTCFLLKQEIEDFLYHEADLLDERRYEHWLALVAEDVRYWMPMQRNVKVDDLEREYTREGRDISWCDEGMDTLTRRVSIGPRSRSPASRIWSPTSTCSTAATSAGIRRMLGKFECCAPFRLDDLFGLVVRPNKRQITRAIYEAKVGRWRSIWPGLTVLPWDDAIPGA